MALLCLFGFFHLGAMDLESPAPLLWVDVSAESPAPLLWVDVSAESPAPLLWVDVSAESPLQDVKVLPIREGRRCLHGLLIQLL